MDMKVASSVGFLHAGSIAFALAELANKLGIPSEALFFAANQKGQKHLHQMLKTVYEAYLVRVPDVSAEELLELFRSENESKGGAGDLEGWDFYRSHAADGDAPRFINGRACSYEWRLWTPGCAVTGKEAAAHAREDGFFGHTGAFIQWRRQNRLGSFFATAPTLDQCWNQGERAVFLPYSSGYVNITEGEEVSLGICNYLMCNLPPQTTFVEFREAKRWQNDKF